MERKKNRLSKAPVQVVGTVHTADGLRTAARLHAGSGVDIVEVRLDCLSALAERLTPLVKAIRLPVLVTARHPREGGAGALSQARRRELLEQFLPLASMIDIELRSAAALSGLVAEASRRRVKVVVSCHHFARTPSRADLAESVRKAVQAGADISKIAAHARNAADLASLLAIQGAAKAPLATMAMGPYGKVSRLLLPAAGSRLAYGYIDRPQVHGQWEAGVLARRLREILP